MVRKKGKKLEKFNIFNHQISQAICIIEKDKATIAILAFLAFSNNKR